MSLLPMFASRHHGRRLVVPLLLAALATPAFAGEASFPVERTEATAGSPRMVSFELREPAAEDRDLGVTSSDPAVLRVMEAGRVLKGQTLGFVRVEGVGAGEATLRLEDERLAVEVRPQLPGPLTRARTPRVVSPPAGAVVWGAIGVGARWTDDLGTGDPSTARLVLPDNTRIEPVEHGPPGSDAWAAFDLDTAGLAPGPLRLVVERPAAGAAPAMRSEPIVVVVADPASLELLAGEAEAERPGPLPQRMGGATKPRTIDDPAASGGKAFANNGQRPVFAFPLGVERAGWYQAFARVRGSYSTGAFPAIGLGVDAEQYARVAGNAMGTRWHRIAVGSPVHLKPPTGEAAKGDREERPEWLGAGELLISYRFLNDHAIGGRGKGKNRLASEDRNLFIDGWELARLDAAPGLTLPVPPDADAAPPDALERGDEADRLHASLDPRLADARVSGGFTIGALVTTPDRKRPDPPAESTLFVNDRALVEQRGASPVFHVPAAALRPGTNELRLRSRVDLAEAWSPPLRVLAPQSSGAPDAEDAAGGAAARFAVDGGDWRRPMAKSGGPSVKTRRASGSVVEEFNFHSNATALLRLPDAMSGRFTGFLEGRPQWYDGPPRFSAELVTGDRTRSLGEHDLRGREASFGELDLPKGEKTLRIAFVNDRFNAQTKQDRNLFLQAVRLEPLVGPDERAPAGEVRWPTRGATLGGFAWVVVDAADARGVTRARPMLDGKPAGPVGSIAPGGGRLLVPLVLRGVGGEHAVSVQLEDAAGNRAETAAVPVRVSGDRGERLAEAVFVLNRLGFGPEPAALADALVEGPREWALKRLRAPDTAGAGAALARAASVEANDFGGGQVQRRGLSWLLAVPDPLEARRVAFLDNHLTTWIQKVQPERQAASFGELVEAADRPFFELLMASATSPAMLRYLDQQRSFVGRINENYAREILELHTVGVHGGYTQADVTGLAAVLTGLTAANAIDNAPIANRTRQAFAFVPSRHDPDAARVFGLDLPAADGPDGGIDAVAAFDRIRRVLEALAAHPATAAHIADKLADHHLGAAEAGDDRDAGVRGAMAAAFLRHQGRLNEVLVAMVEHHAFAAAMGRAAEQGPTADARVARPLDAAVRLQRVTGQVEAGAAANYLSGAGFALFNRETPDGYPDEDGAYADSNATLQRWRYASNAAGRIASRLPYALRKPTAADLKTPATLAAWRQDVVDTLAGTLTGGLLSETSNTAALSVLEAAGERVSDNDVRTVAALVSQLPEGALR